jgi:aspartate aminotransferase-like enzyme
MQQKYGVVLAGGQGSLKTEIFRIGHLGYVSSADIIATLGLLGLCLKDLGLDVNPAGGVSAAVAVLGEAT